MRNDRFKEILQIVEELDVASVIQDILGKQRYLRSKDTIQSDWDRRNPDVPRDPTAKPGERPRRDVFLNLLGIRNNIPGVIKRNTPLGTRVGQELKNLPEPNPEAFEAMKKGWPTNQPSESEHWENVEHPLSIPHLVAMLVAHHLSQTSK